TGLHFHDVAKLLDVLHELVDEGNTVWMIEQNLEVIKTADWIVDLGPEGGDAGGHVVAIGTPEEIAANPASYTGQYLKQVLKRRPSSKAGGKRPAAAQAAEGGPASMQTGSNPEFRNIFCRLRMLPYLSLLKQIISRRKGSCP